MGKEAQGHSYMSCMRHQYHYPNCMTEVQDGSMCTLCQGQFGFLDSNQIGIYGILTVLYHRRG